MYIYYIFAFKFSLFCPSRIDASGSLCQRISPAVFQRLVYTDGLVLLNCKSSKTFWI